MSEPDAAICPEQELTYLLVHASRSKPGHGIDKVSLAGGSRSAAEAAVNRVDALEWTRNQNPGPREEGRPGCDGGMAYTVPPKVLVEYVLPAPCRRN